MYLQGTNLDVADYDGRTALHIAASEGHVELVKFFLSVAQVIHNPKDRYTKIKKLIFTKANCNKHRWGRTPLDEARQFNQLECARLLENYRPEQKRQHRFDENDEGSDSETTISTYDSSQSISEIVVASEDGERNSDKMHEQVIRTT
ncbi:ankyrin repeat protein [Ancylostoma ceylanicum]|uniref:Ankyrin repeat protein n=1 Tax=Ancylostoma ceylanicum TaxID=53326 RepID=A0A0D6L7N8_9BILA|nr:ankyrin repeat protein [Ancylostoma ceylanicum]